MLLVFPVVTCPSTFQMVDAYCIKLVDSPEMTPDDGEALCGTLGGRLIWMTSVEMYDVIVAVIGTYLHIQIPTHL